jgi:hypothetical protein
MGLSPGWITAHLFKIERPCSIVNTLAPGIVPLKRWNFSVGRIECAPHRKPEARRFVARAKKKKQPFNVNSFLSRANGGRTITPYRKNEKIFSQGDPADAVFFNSLKTPRYGSPVSSNQATMQSSPRTSMAS